jgi:hypothetical protein
VISGKAGAESLFRKYQEATDPKKLAAIKCPKDGSKKQDHLPPFPRISFPHLLFSASNLDAPAHAP